MKKGVIIVLCLTVLFLLIPSALAWNHSRGLFTPSLLESITEKQEEEIVSFMVEQRLAMMRKKGRLQEIREELMALRRDFDTDPQVVEDLLYEMATVRAEIYRTQQQQFQELKEILTEEQLAHYMDLLEEREVREDKDLHLHGKGRISHGRRGFHH